MNIQKIIKTINKHKSFLIITHVNPDGDALGSQLALARVLRQLGKKVYMLAESPLPYMYKFLPDVNKIKTNFKTFNKKFDVVIILDCTNISRVGKLKKLIKEQIKITIDHHPGDGHYMGTLFKDTTYAATCEMIYKLFEKMKAKIDDKTSALLYAGIATDTGFFRYSNTTPRTHKIASSLIELGAEPVHLMSQLYESESIKRLRLLGLSLLTLKLHKNGKIASMKVTSQMYRRTNTGPQYTEEFANFPRSIKGVLIAILLKSDKKKDIVKISLRSKHKVNVDKIARIFGGGGHPQASGCTLKGNIDEVEKKVVKIIKKFIK